MMNIYVKNRLGLYNNARSNTLPPTGQDRKRDEQQLYGPLKIVLLSGSEQKS